MKPATNNWDQYLRDGFIELRQLVYGEGNPLLFEYTEWPFFHAEFWLLSFQEIGGQPHICLGHWNILPARKQFEELGLVHEKPALRGWRRPLTAEEWEELKGHLRAIRASFPPTSREPIVLDGVEKTVHLQEEEHLPVIQYHWNTESVMPALNAVSAWTEVIRMRRFVRK